MKQIAYECELPHPPPLPPGKHNYPSDPPLEKMSGSAHVKFVGFFKIKRYSN